MLACLKQSILVGVCLGAPAPFAVLCLVCTRRRFVHVFCFVSRIKNLKVVSMRALLLAGSDNGVLVPRPNLVHMYHLFFGMGLDGIHTTHALAAASGRLPLMCPGRAEAVVSSALRGNHRRGSGARRTGESWESRKRGAGG